MNKNLDRFEKYLQKELDIQNPLGITCEINERYKREFHLFEYAIQDDHYLGKVSISINPASSKGVIKFYNEKDEEIKSKNITIKKFNSQMALYI